MIALYVASPEPYAGKTLTCVALGKYWKSQGKRVGYIKPLGVLPATAESQLSDEDARLVAGEIGLDAPISQLCPVVMGRQTCPSDSEFARRQVQEAYAAVSAGKDIMLIGGSGAVLSRGIMVGLHGAAVVEFLDAKALLVARCESVLEVDGIIAAQQALGHRLLGVILNRVPARYRETVENEVVPCLEQLGLRVFGLLPEDRVLNSVSVEELVRAVGGEVLAGAESTDELIESFVVGAMGVTAALRYFRQTPRKCVITGGDRGDIQLAALETPTRCLVLTGGLEPSPAVVARAEELAIPLVLVREDTLTVVSTIEHLLGQLRLREPRKVERALAAFEEHIDLRLLEDALGLT